MRNTLAVATAVAAMSRTLTPELVLSAPRIASVAVNLAGTRALVGSSQFDFASDRWNKSLSALSIPSASTAISSAPTATAIHTALHDAGDKEAAKHAATEGFWLSDNEAAFVVDGDLYVKDVTSSAASEDDLGPKAGAFPTDVSNLRVAISGKDTITLLFSADVYLSDGDLTAVKKHDESPEQEEFGRAKVYDRLMVRHWDAWSNHAKASHLFTVDLTRSSSGWKLEQDYKNLLQGSNLETPVPPFGGEDDFDVHESGWVVFISKDPEVPEAWHTRTNVYAVPLDGSAKPVRISAGTHGAISSPVFSPDGTQVAWLEMAKDGFESDKRQVVVYDFPSSGPVDAGQHHYLLPTWDRSPAKISFTARGSALLAQTEDEEHTKLFTIDLIHKSANEALTPQVLIDQVGVKAFKPLPDGRVVVTGSTLQSSPDVYLFSGTLSKSEEETRTEVQKLTNLNAFLDGVDLGPKPEQFSYPGANGREAHGWIHLPPGFDETAKHKYPLKVLFHGGPEGCWDNSWSTRWNPLVFAAPTPFQGGAAQEDAKTVGAASSDGAVVITMDPAGSTSFGQAYQEEILNNWGVTQHDIQAGVQYIVRRFPAIDPERIVGAGASYGGFVATWLEGHNDQGLFKGLVDHDGVLSTREIYLTTEELYFPEHEFGGTPWDVPEQYQRWDPVNHLHRWNTPMLVVHGGHDYRIPESTGLAAFNVLQRRGVPSRLLYFDKESHWVLDPKNSIVWHREVLGWLNRWATPQVFNKHWNSTAQPADQVPKLVIQ